uniref:Jasmonate O-methyltransferase n=1 Tax=Oryza punctata TaxID=4537 RepID=A0A0E0KXF2_ORYPU
MELLPPPPSQEGGVHVVVGMNSGDAGELSYANNSDMQRTIAAATRKERQQMAAAVRRARRHATAMAIADLGCATGPNALLMAADAVEAMLADADRQQEAPPAEFHVFLNDLPSNDFNSVFRQKQKLLPPERESSCRCLLSAWPGSFYGRIFPADSLDYVVSSSSLHFLSRAPADAAPNEGRMYVSATAGGASRSRVLDAYRAQFQADFRLFLACRAEEVRRGGLLLLTFVARREAVPSPHDCHLWDLLAEALLVVDDARRKLDSFDAPFYGPCPEELTEAIREEGSFEVRRMELFEVSRCQAQAAELAAQTSSTIRAVVEPMLGAHFGWDAMDALFRRYTQLLDKYYRHNDKLDQLTNVFLALDKI